MITRPVSDLHKGDRIRFGQHNVYELARAPQTHFYEHALRILHFTGGPGDVTMPADAAVTVERMIREVAVPCIVHRDDVRILIDLAVSPVPFGVLCGDCDAKETVQVMQWMTEKNQKG